MKYGKLIEGALIPAPEQLKIDGKVYYNPSGERYRSQGYMPVIDNPPLREEGVLKYYREQWEEQNGVIVKTYIEAAPPEAPAAVPTTEERISALEMRVAELSNYNKEKV